MDRREETLKEFVTQVWNYNEEVFNTFDEIDFKKIENTLTFQLWNLKRTLKGLLHEGLSRF